MKKKYKKQILNNSTHKTAAPIIPDLPKTSLSRKFILLSHLLIIAVGFIVYINSLNGQFLYDDKGLVERSSFIKSPSGIIECFTKGEFEGVGRVSNFYRPLQIASYGLNYAIGKLDVRGYHLVNVLLHILVALSIFWLIYVLFNNHILSLITALLFVVHPIHTEAVSYISGRGDPLALFFMIVCFIIYVKQLSWDRFNIPAYIFLLLSYLCALLAKEHSIILPVLLLLYHGVFRKKINAVAFFSVLGFAIIYLYMRFIHLTVVTSPNSDTVFDRIPGFFIAILTYIKLILIPFPLHMEYGQKLFEWSDPRAIGGLILVLTAGTWGYFQRNNKTILFAIGWFFLAIVPVSNLYKINFYMAEHFMYIPSVGIFLLIAYFLSRLYDNSKFKIIAIILTAGALLFFMVLTIRQNHYWKDPVTFYETTLKYAPESSNIYNDLGEIYKDKGDLKGALDIVNRAIQFNPANAEAYHNGGNLYFIQGNYAQAIPYYNKTIELDPNHTETYNSRGIACFNIGNYDQAILDFTKVIGLDPKSAEAYHDLASAYNSRGYKYNQTGQIEQAISDFNKAIELQADLADAYFNRGNAYGLKGNDEQAIMDFNKAISLKSGLANVYNNRGYIYNKIGRLEQALLDFNKAIEIKPDFAEAYFNRGTAYGNKGNLDQAIVDYNKAIESNPNYAEAYLNRSKVYYFKKEYDKAWGDLHQLEKLGVPIDPKYLETLKQSTGEDK